MPSPNFSKTQTYSNIYEDNTPYLVNTVNPTLATFNWSFAVISVLPVPGQFPNINQNNNNPARIRLRMAGTGVQGATAQNLVVNLVVFGATMTLTYPAADFTPAQAFGCSLVADITVLPSGGSFGVINGIVNQLNAPAVGLAASNYLNNFNTVAQVQGGGNAAIYLSFGAAGSTFTSLSNSIEIIPQLWPTSPTWAKARPRHS